jgi:hypothetical protein
MNRIPRFHDPFREHTLLAFLVQVVCKKWRRFGNGFSREEYILKIHVQYLLHNRLEIELLFNLMVLVDAFINKKLTKKCGIPQ